MNSPIDASQTRPPARKQPNILFITSDQHRADCFGFENSQVKTPHLDRLARQGTRFTRCFTPNLVCQPSRASILTGQLPLTHGAWDNGVDLDPAVGAQGMAGRLSAAGYRTGFVGKAHFSTKNTFKPTGTHESRHSAPGTAPTGTARTWGSSMSNWPRWASFTAAGSRPRPRRFTDSSRRCCAMKTRWPFGNKGWVKTAAQPRHGTPHCRWPGTAVHGWQIARWRFWNGIR